MSLITLTTDFGLLDSYVGAMKGVILSLAPGVQIVDISHETPPQDIHHAAYLLRGIAPYFPASTIHVVVVDPGVGSQRRPIAIRTDQGTFVGPDNGVFSWILAEQPAALAVHLTNPAYWLPTVSRTFHGRDLFAPVAAHLAAGAPFDALGPAIADPVTFPLPRPQRRADGSIAGQLIASDRFGNLISAIPADWLAGRRWVIHVAGQAILGPSETYTAAAPGALLALIGSGGLLELAVRNGSAAQRLGIQPGEPIEAWPHDMVDTA